MIKNLAFCSDCKTVATTGDYSFLDCFYSEIEAEIKMKEIDSGLERWARIGYLVLSTDYDEFSLRTCSCCGDKLAGERFYFEINL